MQAFWALFPPAVILYLQILEYFNINPEINIMAYT